MSRLGASLHGSLAFTGKGHSTDRAVVLGLLGFRPDRLDPVAAEALEAAVRNSGRIAPPGLSDLTFDPDRDLVFDYDPPLPGHANGLVLRAFDERGNPDLTQAYYSVGGGFVVTAAELEASKSGDLHAQKAAKGHLYPFGTAVEMLAMDQATGLTIAERSRANELVHSGPGLDDRLDALWQAMDACITRGLRKDGILLGGLKVKPRARAIHEQLLVERGQNQSQPHVVNDGLSVYAMAVNEENAAVGRVVTSPTHGAAGACPR